MKVRVFFCFMVLCLFLQATRVDEEVEDFLTIHLRVLTC